MCARNDFIIKWFNICSSQLVQFRSSFYGVPSFDSEILSGAGEREPNGRKRVKLSRNKKEKETWKTKPPFNHGQRPVVNHFLSNVNCPKTVWNEASIVTTWSTKKICIFFLRLKQKIRWTKKTIFFYWHVPTWTVRWWNSFQFLSIDNQSDLEKAMVLHFYFEHDAELWKKSIMAKKNALQIKHTITVFFSRLRWNQMKQILQSIS